MPSLRDAAEWVVKRISALTRTATDADLTDGEYMAVDKSDGYTRKITVASLAGWVLGKIKGLSTTATESDLVSGNYLAIDGAGGTKKLPAEFLGNIIDNFPEDYDSAKTYDAGALFNVDGKIWQAKRNTANVQAQYIAAYADPLPIEYLVDAVFNKDKNVITLFENIGVFISSAGVESTNNGYATTCYISVERMTSLYVKTHFGNQYGGGVVCYDGDYNFVGSIYDDGEGGYSGIGSNMVRTFVPSDLPSGTQFIRVVRVINQSNSSIVIVNGVEGGGAAKKLTTSEVSPDFSNKKNYTRGNIVNDCGKVYECTSHLFGSSFDSTKFDNKTISKIIESILTNGSRTITEFEFDKTFVNSNGIISSSSGFETTGFISLYGVDCIVALGNFGNQYGGGLSFYDEGYNFILSIHDDGSGNYPNVNNEIVRTFTSSDFPVGSKYVRLTNRYGSIYPKGYIILSGENINGGYVGGCDTLNPKRCGNFLTAQKASIQQNESVSIPYSPNTKNNYTISAFAKFSTFGRLSLYHGTSAYLIGHVEIDDTNIYQYNYKNGNLLSTTPHGLTMSDYIHISVSVGQAYNATAQLVITTGTQKKVMDIEWSGCNEDITLKSISGSYTDASVTLSGNGYRLDTWVFGDSYCDMWPDKLLEIYPDAKFMLDSYSGRNSENAYNSFISDLRIGYKPKRLIWAMGMNDADSGSVNASYKLYFDKVKSICEKIGIDFIPCTIPCTPTRDNSYKNAYAIANSKECIDVAGAVGATAQNSSWFTGLLASDNVHPSSAGQYVIAQTFAGYLGIS